MPDFNKLQKHVDKLSTLLGSKQIGKMSWNAFVAEHWKAIVEMWDNPEDKSEGPKGLTPKRAKELERKSIVYDVGFNGDQLEIVKGVLLDVGPNCFQPKKN